MKLKKISAIILALVMLLGVTACTAPASEPANASTAPIVTTQAIETTAAEIESDKLNWAEPHVYNLSEDEEVKNIILLIGDGMGENIIKNAEIVKGDALAMQTMPHSCYVGTDNALGKVTDSAAASTAISTGVKTRNQLVGLDENRNPVETICEFAMARGLKTGLVDTHVIPHATPAGMATHCSDRGLYNSILSDMLKMGINVLLGGGQEYIDTQKMQKRIADCGYTYIQTTEELAKVPSDTEKLLGGFAYQDLNASKNPSLTTMCAKALELLEGDEGFFLMVEASHIDIYEAKLDMDKTIDEMMAFDKCIDYVLSWAQSHPGTLVIVTADHETGGVTVPESGNAEDVNADCFTSGGEHTGADVLLFAAGARSGELFTEEKIENTDISKIMKKALNDTYGEKPEFIFE